MRFIFRFKGTHHLGNNKKEHLKKGHTIYICEQTPEWYYIQGEIKNEILNDLENKAIQTIIFSSREVLEKVKLSKLDEVNKAYYNEYDKATKSQNPKTLVAVLGMIHIKPGEDEDEVCDKIFDKIEKSLGIEYDDDRIYYLYTPNDGMVWA